ncbi:MAG: class I SAM-dependent methyltransferase [Fibrobacter sp.]|nr:class I SAM-dependent methyltransferase [Fibrobacter sp.]
MNFFDSIKDQFNLVAKEYDKNRRKFIPYFDDYYIATTELIAKEICTVPRKIVDLGAGTGILTQFWYEHFPEARYVLVDIAEEMLAIAKKRFNGCANVEYRAMDYSVALPDCTNGEDGASRPDIFISALSIHHLEHEQKKNLFKMIYENLPAGGIFVNYDQFCLDDATLNASVEAHWTKGILASGLAQSEIERWQSRKKLDRECSVANEIDWIKDAGFSSAENLFFHGKFGVIIARK